MELVQRGVLVSLKDDNLQAWDASKTLDAVHSSIGKAVLHEGGSLPTPLLAASAVMAGRVAEFCAASCRADWNGTTATTISKLFDQQAVASALTRCQEISDPRFQVLLELLLTPSAEEEDDATGTRSSTRLLHIAEGYFLRGTTFQPDTPQMWKKAYDVILLRHTRREEDVSPGDAAGVLQNMARIATTKGNVPRATELTARSVESYLQLALQRNDSDTTATNSRVEDAFVRPYKPLIQHPLDQAESALETCQQHQDVLSPEQLFVVELLRVQLQLAQEDETIHRESQQAHQQAQNRAAEAKPTKGGKAGSGTLAKPPSLAAIRLKTRNQILVEGGRVQDVSAVRLRDATLERLGHPMAGGGGNSDTAAMRTVSAARTLQRVLLRQRDRAKALACQKASRPEGWVSLGDFLGPFLTFTQSTLLALLAANGTGTDASTAAPMETWFHTLSKEASELVETYVTLVPCVEWMVCSATASNNHSSGIHEYLPLVQQALDALVSRAVHAKKDYQASSNVLKTSTEPLDVKIRQLECARASVQSLTLMRQVGDGSVVVTVKKKASSANDLKVHSEVAVKMAQRADKYQASSMEYGTGFWNFVLAWSGLQQSCWSFCTAPEARMILKHAVSSITQAKKEWGRPVSNLEQLMLDLGQADAECGVLSGGLPSVATKLYHDVLERASSLELADALQSVVKSHCWIGLTRLALFGSSKIAEDSDPADLAQKSLGELASVAVDKELPVAYLWTAPGATLSFVKFHMTASRQLVADALVRSGRAPEAKQFLEDAVRDSPTDAEAAFSLGAFLLRDAFNAAERSASDLNAAKMQLLKSAKLDSRKAGPFALLGVWYEDQGDRKRALGCYSKALLLDPPHPVAGRGVMRLTTFDSARAVIDVAVQTSSAVNGWAWRALGKQKVMVTGENDLGAVALLKALRCRDIDQPQNEALSVFFSVQSSSEGSTDHYRSREKAESWSELAFCYRRLGRYTAAIRGYYSSIEASGDNVTGSVLCACAEGMQP